MFCTQFHPEANEAMLRRWTTGFGAEELDTHRFEPGGADGDHAGVGGGEPPNADRIVDWFLESVVPSEFHDVLDAP
jgi:hypothetical protein